MPRRRPNLPSTEDLLLQIKEQGFTSWREWCRENGWSRSTVQDILNDRSKTSTISDYQLVLNALRQNKMADKHENRVRYAQRDGQVVYKDLEEVEPHHHGNVMSVTTSSPGTSDWPLVSPRIDKSLAVDEQFPLDDNYTGDEVDEILRAEKNRSKALQAKVTQLRRALYDQTESRREFANLLAESMASQNNPVQDVMRIEPNGPGEDFVVFAPIADPHLGKHVWGAEGWGRDYDTDIACERLIDGANQVAEWVANEPGRCIRLISGDVGDYWHALDGQTESGTLLHQDTRAKKVWDKGSRTRIATFNIYKAVADVVEGEFTEGNHDHLWLHAFYSGLFYKFEEDPKVSINVGFQRKAAFIVGNSGFVLDHGKGVSSLATPTSKLKARTAVNRSIPSSTRRGLDRLFWFCGHLHHEQVVQDEDLTLTRLPAITEPDEYEEGLRVATPPGQRAYRINATTGEIEAIKRISF